MTKDDVMQLPRSEWEAMRDVVNALDVSALAAGRYGEEYALERSADYTDSAPRYVCPSCGAGHKTGAWRIPESNKYYCDKCQHAIDAVAMIQGARQCDYPDALAYGTEIAGYTPTAHPSSRRPRSTAAEDFTPILDDGLSGTQSPHAETIAAAAPVTPPSAPPDVTHEHDAMIAAAQSQLTEGSPGALYLDGRGISLDVARSAGIGYLPDWKHPAVPDYVPTSPRIIVPMDTGTYETRDIRPDTELQRIGGNALKYKKQSVSPKGLYRPDPHALDGTEPVYIVEGWADALAVTCAGGKAISLNSTSGKTRLMADLKSRQPEGVPPLILALDPDKAGKDKQADLAMFCRQRGLRYINGTICSDGHDPADAWMADRTCFVTSLAADIARARTVVPTEPQSAAAATTAAPGQSAQPMILQGMGAATYAAERYRDDIAHLAQYRMRRTGFSNLDAQGPLYPGLYCIGAITSLGKTTFCLQLADNLAARGETVLYFSIEQDLRMMHSKSNARAMYESIGLDAPGSIALASGARDIESRVDTSTAHKHYLDAVGDRLIVFDCGSRVRPMDIAATVRAYAEQMQADALQASVPDYAERMRRPVRQAGGEKDNSVEADTPQFRGPVVIVDYIQRLRPDNPRDTERASMDNAVSTMQDLVLQTGSTVIAVSSLNRASYLQPITLESVKESGGIEFTADVFWGLELGCMRSPMFAQEKGEVAKRAVITRAKKEMPREVRLVCLKNRFGISSYEALFYYYPDHDYFEALEESDSRVELNKDTGTLDFKPPVGRPSWRTLAAEYLESASAFKGVDMEPVLTGETITLTTDIIQRMSADAVHRLYVGLVPPDARRRVRSLKASVARKNLLQMLESGPMEFEIYSDTPELPEE